MRFGFLLLTILCSTVGAAAQAESSFVRHLRILASDEMRGRGNDQPELLEAASYIAAEFNRLGLVPAAPGGSYFQPFTVTTAVEVGDRSDCTFYNLMGFPASLTYGTDYTSLAFGEENELNGPLVFAGFGISAPELNYDDYASIDASGKVAVVFEHEPGERRHDSPFDGFSPTFHSSLMRKARTAQEHGAVGLIVLPDSFNHPRRRDSLPVVERMKSLGIPVLRLSESWSRRLWAQSSRDQREAWRWIDRRMTPYSFDWEGTYVRIYLDLKPASHQVNNVVALLPGSTWQHLILGAHYDHLGTGGGASLEAFEEGEIHNGADDNASGVAALLQLAEDLSARPRRFGLLFVAFAGEELGLLGSDHYVREPLLPLSEALCMLNFDMIGRSEGSLLIGGVGTSPDFGPLLDELASQTPLTLQIAETAGGSSDHLPFSRQTVPVLFFFSGLHADYHRPTDDFHRIDLDGAEQIVSLAARLVNTVDGLEWAIRRTAPDLLDRPAAPERETSFGPLFGGLVDMVFEGSGVRFSEVLRGSPAQIGGVRSGDILVRFEGVPVRNNYEFTRELRSRHPGDTVRVVVIRNQIKRELLVRLAARD